MKKSISLVLGLTVVAGSLLSGVHASREAYHNYLYSKEYYERTANRDTNPNNLAFRPFSDRASGWKQSGFQTATGSTKTMDQAYDVDRLYRGSRANSAFWADRPRVQTRGEFKPMARREGRWQVATNTTRSSVAFNNIPDVDYGMTYETESFVVGIPDHFVVEAGENSLTATDGSLEVVVESVENTCGVIGFFACSVGISENRNGYGGDKMQSQSRIERSTLNTYKFLQSNDVTPTYTESFAAVKEGESVYVTRYYVVNGDTIYVVEGMSPLNRGSELVAHSKKIFNSFHIK